jgi:hypothetical protein
MPEEVEVVLYCQICGREFWRGCVEAVPSVVVDGIAPMLCNDHLAEQEALESWEGSLEERFLSDQYDQLIRAREELK